MKRFMFIALLFIILAPQVDAQMRGLPYTPRVRSWRLGLAAGMGVLGGDLTRESQNYHFRPIANLEVAYLLHKNFAVGGYLGGGYLRSTELDMESNTSFINAGILLEFRIPILRGSVSPIFQLRSGPVSISPELRTGPVTVEASSSINYSYDLAAGIEVMSYNRLGIRVLVGVTYTTTDEWDLLVRGNDNDGYSFSMLSMHYYINPRR
ncbi:MAG: hypothetical protein WBQ23_14430 [Bacteroidota bacterium]